MKLTWLSMAITHHGGAVMANWKMSGNLETKGLCTTWLEKLASPYLQMQAQTSIKPPEINIFIREVKSLFCLQIRSGRLFLLGQEQALPRLLDFCCSEQLWKKMRQKKMMCALVIGV